MGLFDFRDKWESDTSKTVSDKDLFGGQPIDESKDNPLVKELDEFKTGDSEKEVPEGWQDPLSTSGDSTGSFTTDTTFDTANNCVISTDCPSGYSCVDNTCVRTGIFGYSANGASGPGTCDYPDSYLDSINDKCNDGGPDSCSGGGTCGSGSETVGSWKSRTHDDGGGCCGNYLGYIIGAGNEKFYFCEFAGFDTPWKCDSFCDAVWDYDDTSTADFFDCGDKLCPNPACEDCDFFTGECEPGFGTLPCFCPGWGCPSCYICSTDDGGQCTVKSGDVACLKKVTINCQCGCFGDSFEITGTGIDEFKARDAAFDACNAKCGDDVVDCEQACRIECHCNADCPSGFCGPDAKCAST